MEVAVEEAVAEVAVVSFACTRVVNVRAGVSKEFRFTPVAFQNQCGCLA